MYIRSVVASGLLLLCGSAAAEGAPIGGVGVHLGTTGIGLDYTYPVNKWVDVRGGFNFGSYSRTQSESDIDYHAKVKISALQAMVDVKPFAGGFRLSMGLYSTPPKFELAANLQNNQDVSIGDNQYTVGQGFRLDGDIKLGSAAPYIGLGWGGTGNGRGFGVSFDIGAMFTSSPDASLAAQGRACDSTNAPCDPATQGFDVNDGSPQSQAFQQQLTKETQSVESDAKDFKTWPVIMLGLHYRF